MSSYKKDNTGTGPPKPHIQKALELNKLGLSTAAIARDIGVHPNTVRTWLRQHGVKPKKKVKPPLNKAQRQKLEEKKKGKKKQEAPPAEVESEIKDTLKKSVASLAEQKYEASLKEDNDLISVADSQATPADQYQHYIAAAGIKLMRDSIRSLRGPRSVRELSELDQLIRRNLGLNAKSSGGNGRMTIDISILNNSAADKGGGTVSKLKKDVVEAEVVKEPLPDEQ